MRLLLSNTPGTVLEQEHQNKAISKWIYFGTNEKVLKKLKALLGKGGQVDYGERLYQLSNSRRNDFVNWLDEVSSRIPNRKEWIFSVPAVKNLTSSKLFLNICYLLVLDEMLEAGGELDLIVVDSPALFSVIKKSYKGKIEVHGPVFISKCGIAIRTSLKSFLRFCKYLIEFGRKFILAKYIFKDRRKEVLSDKKDIVLIRNFITGKFKDSDEDIIERHFFPGLYSFLEKNDYTPIFLPVIVQTTQYAELFKKVAKSKRNIIFPEEFLNIADVGYTFLAPLRALTVKLICPDFEKFNIKKILVEEFRANVTEFGLLYATLLSCVGKRIKELNVTPRGIVNWSENQALEKGLIRGLRENFKDIQVIGSQPFVAPINYLMTVFSKQDELFNLVPNKVLVLGPVEKDSMTEYIKDLPIDYSPPFRYAHTFDEPLKANKGKKLLVLFGYNLDNAVSIMQMILNINDHLGGFENIMIKLHPAAFSQQTLLNALGQELPQNYKFVEGRLEQYLDETAVGVCGASGAAVELAMKGIPVVIVGESHSLTMDYLGYKHDQDLWQLCFNSSQILEALTHFKNLKANDSQGLVKRAEDFCGAFLAEPSEGYWENYLIK